MSSLFFRRITRLNGRSFSKSAVKEPRRIASSSLQIQDISQSDIVVEKVSLSRGLAQNKFEKDFLIYPEYTDADEVRNIEGYTDVLLKTLKIATEGSTIEKEGALSDKINFALEKNGINSVFVPSEYGGLGMCLKDISQVFEVLSLDWNIFYNVNIIRSTSQLLVLYGSEEQKSKYLPLLANGKCRPGLVLPHLIGNNGGWAECTSTSSAFTLLSAQNVPIVCVPNPNLLFVFGKTKNAQTKQLETNCYIIDSNDLKETDKMEIKRKDTLGLKASNIANLNLMVNVSDDAILGESNQGAEISDEVVCENYLPLAAATVGYAKRLLTQLTSIANRTDGRQNTTVTLAEETGAQRCASALGLKLYALESALYYLSGMLDEGIPVVVDIEASLLFRLTRDLLHSCVSATLELGGIRSADSQLEFEKDIRDISTLLSLHSEGNVVESVAMATLSSWASTSHERITSTIRRLFKNDNIKADLKNPKLTHFIAEHAHPSLQMACQELEFSMSRLNVVISKMVQEQGKNLEMDYGSLENVVTVLQNQMGMVAVIARASRSYSIGLKNSDLELAWATTLCTRLSRSNWFELEAMSDYFGLVRFNPSLLNTGRAIFDLGGYKIESPTQKNW